MRRCDGDYELLPFYILHGDGVWFTKEDIRGTDMGRSRAERIARHMSETNISSDGCGHVDLLSIRRWYPVLILSCIRISLVLLFSEGQRFTDLLLNLRSLYHCAFLLNVDYPLF